MYILGITGPSGSGKSVLCQYLAQSGVIHIDADAVYHNLLVPPSPCLAAIRENFGDGVFLPDGTLDRGALGAIVFSDQAKLELLNETVLSFVTRKLHRMFLTFRENGENYIALDAPTLIESGLDRNCNSVLSVLAPREERIRRIMERDGIDRERAQKRTDAQKSDDFYREHSDLVLMNNGSPEALLAPLPELFAKRRIFPGLVLLPCSTMKKQKGGAL